MIKKVTFALTSCGRPDLLEKTMDSFIKYNTYPIEKYIITEDSNMVDINKLLIEKYSDLNIEWIINKERLGQIKSIDNMYEKIDTEYIFHCEEDWLFKDYSFIEKSLIILESEPKILMVHLRGRNNINGHPTIDFNNEYDILAYNYLGVWHGFSFNPGLRRLSDYKLISPYKNTGHEPQLSIKYKELGFKVAVLKNIYVDHIGWGKHVDDVK